VTEEDGRAPKQHVDEEIRLMRGVLGGILADDSHRGKQKVFRACKEFGPVLWFCTEASLEFARWLVATLNAVIVAAQKRGKPNELNQERLWRKFKIIDNIYHTRDWKPWQSIPINRFT